MPGVKGRSGRKASERVRLFREFCRDLTADPEIRATLTERAKADPVFALKLFEYGIGRPYQAHYVRGEVSHEHTRVREVELADGSPAFTETPAVSTFGPN